MKIALVGFGKMGHMIQQIALKRGNEVVLTADPFAPDADVKEQDSEKIAEAVKKSGAEAVIEFTHPNSVMNNINALIATDIPVIVGTTGWYAHLDDVKKAVKTNNASLFYAANYSIGVNLFYKIVKGAAAVISAYDEYDAAVWEAHHNQKADSPSGTALDVAKMVMEGMKKKTELVIGNFEGRPKKEQLQVASTRVGSVPGTHTVYFDSVADTIELTHTARSREGFALGAVVAAEWMANGLKSGSLKKGETYTMTDLMK